MSTALAEKPKFVLDEVEWEQTIQVRQYEPAKCSVKRTLLVDPSGDPEEQIALTRDAIARCRMDVEDALGIKDRETNVSELIESAFPGARAVAEHPATASAVDAATAAPAGHTNPPESVGPNPPHAVLAKPRRDMTELEKAMDKENVAWAKARLMTHPDEFYDNTLSKSNPNAPDFRHKTHKIGVWVDSK